METQLAFPQRGTAPLQTSTHVCCGQTAGWIKTPLGTAVGLSPGDIVLYGDPAPPKTGAQHPQFWPMSVVAKRLDGSQCDRWEPSSPPRKGHSSPLFSVHVYCGQTVAHLSYC